MFLVFFSAYDTLAGIGTGLAMRSARDLSPAQQEGVFLVVKDWPGLAPPFILSILGTGGWILAVGGLALAVRRQGSPRREWVPLALAAAFLMGGPASCSRSVSRHSTADGSLFATSVIFTPGRNPRI